MKPSTIAAAACLIASAIPAQMSGSYLIDPASPGQFATFTEAVNAMFVNGVNGPVTILVSPGAYNESVLVPPINGASSTNTITFLALAGPGTVQITGAGGDTFALLGVAFQHNRSIVWDGISFMGAPGHAISGTTWAEDMEIRNCYFAEGHRSTAPGEFRHAVLVSENGSGQLPWRVHHNTITMSTYTNRTSYGIYMSNAGGWEVHHNTFDLNGGDYALYMINNNSALDRVYNNLFVGALHATGGTSANSTCVIRADISNYNNQITHNTFAVTLPSNGCCLSISSVGSNLNYVYGNVFWTLGGTAIVTAASSGAPKPFESNGNVFFCPGGDIGRVDASASTGTGYASLAAWQVATGKDGASLETDPLLNNPFGTPPDLRPLPASPITGVAVNTPSWVVDDFAGRLRDSQPDAGAYESTSFALYGTACPGTGGLAPALGSTGTAAIGSPTFAFTLAQTPPVSIALLVGGLSRSFWSGGLLPAPVGGGCELLTSPDATALFLTDASGSVALPFPIPNDPLLSGTDLFFQWAVSDPGAGSVLGLSFSEGGALQL